MTRCREPRKRAQHRTNRGTGQGAKDSRAPTPAHRTYGQREAGPGGTPERTSGRGWEIARPRTPHTKARGAPPGRPRDAPTARKASSQERALWGWRAEDSKESKMHDAPERSIRGGVELGPSPRTGSSGGEPGATDWSVRANGGDTSKRRPGLEHLGRSGARHKPQDWIVRGTTRCHGLERPRQRREYDKKTPRIGASGTEWSTAQAPGLDRPGGNPGPQTGRSKATERIRQKDAPDWSIRGGQEQGPNPRTGSSGGAPRAADSNIRGRNAPGLERPGTKRPGNGMSRATNKEMETAAERHREENKSRERMGEDKKERRREAGGEREEGEAAKHMEPGWEQPGKQRNQSGSTGMGRHRRSSSESGRGSVRKEQRRRQEPKRRA